MCGIDIVSRDGKKLVARLNVIYDGSWDVISVEISQQGQVYIGSKIGGKNVIFVYQLLQDLSQQPLTLTHPNAKNPDFLTAFELCTTMRRTDPLKPV